MIKLTIFTPTYNRRHTLGRLYMSLCQQTNCDFEWLVVDDGSNDGTNELITSYITENKINIRYIFKENGGLYTGYNTAYANISTELNMCVDSDDFLPLNAVELILRKWGTDGSEKYAGIVGLDFSAKTGLPIGGRFNDDMKECYFYEFRSKGLHNGDTKQVMRTDLMKKVAPQIGFQGEKYFNPYYMLLQVCNHYPLLILNENLCYVDYQDNDSMSADIYRQYIQSPKSFIKLRLLELELMHNSFRRRYIVAVHLIAECLLANNFKTIFSNPYWVMTSLAFIPGILLYIYIRLKVGGNLS